MSRRGVALLAAACAVLVAGCGGPGPALSDLEDEPVLVAPVPATELGRGVRQHEYGLGMGPDSFAYSVVAYELDASLAEAREAWVDAYGSSYALEPEDQLDQEQIGLSGRGERFSVTIVVADEVAEPYEQDGEFAEPAGGAVVTVFVYGFE